MYSGFVSQTKVVKRVGIHQRFDTAAYRMIEPLLAPGVFPGIREILHFEGWKGPDGLKIKAKGESQPSHLYDPATDRGEVPMHITNHYDGLVAALVRGDQIRAAFEAGWLAHYVCDGLTPAHHFPLEEKISDLHQDEIAAIKNGEIAPIVAHARRRWGMYGAKGLLSTHVNFEVGVAFVLVFQRLKVKFSFDELERARNDGYLVYFKHQASDIAVHNLYDRFYASGWTADIAATVRDHIAPPTALTIGIIWLLAYERAGFALNAPEHHASAGR